MRASVAHSSDAGTVESGARRAVGAQLFFKCENLQKVAAFKARGACNAVLSLSAAEAQRGVVTHSSGNHGAALAWAARSRGIPAWIVMPSMRRRSKQDAVRGFGGTIRFCEPTVAAREAACAAVQAETGATLVHPYNDWRVIAGQGTAALELLEDEPELDAVITPVGGGGGCSRAPPSPQRYRAVDQGLRRGAGRRRRRLSIAARRPHHPADRSAHHRRRAALVAGRKDLRGAEHSRRSRSKRHRRKRSCGRCGCSGTSSR